LINSNEILWNTFVAGDLRVGLMNADINVLETNAAALLCRSKENCGDMELEKIIILHIHNISRKFKIKL
jgi:hypothetical protein